MSNLPTPNFTQVPNIVIDHWMAKLSHSEFKIIMLIFRQTTGFHRRSAFISYEDFEQKCNVTRKWVIECCKKLAKAKWIKVTPGNNNSKNKYEIIFEDSKKICSEVSSPAGEVSTPRCGEVSTPETPEAKESLERKKERKEETDAVSLSQESLRLSSLLKDQIKKNDPAFSQTDQQMKKWATEIDRMHRIDKRSWDEIERLILFAHENEFWRANILSGSKLRSKATQLLLQMSKTPSTGQVMSTLYDDNKRLANEKFSHYDMWILRIDEEQVSVKVGGNWLGAPYQDHGLLDRVKKLLELGGHL